MLVTVPKVQHAVRQAELGLLERDLGAMKLEALELRAAAGEREASLTALQGVLEERDGQARTDAH